MNIEKRMKEIATSIISFSKTEYHKREILPELFNLQQEIVTLTFNEDHSELGNLKLWDVEKHLEQMNNDYGEVASESLRRFKAGCKIICNLIRSEVSGNQGEAKAFYSLEDLKSEHLTLRNIEMSNACSRSEIDAVVITRKGAFIVEVKNTAKNIFIDVNGDYYRTGEYLRWDSNIDEKMSVKKDLLREVLRKEGLDKIDIFSIVVFTNNRIEVRNLNARINTCFLSQLPHIIDEWNGPSYLSVEDMKRAEKAIDIAKCEASYPLEFDVYQFKRDFAQVISELEAASIKEGMENETEISNQDKVRVKIKDKQVCKKTFKPFIPITFLNSYYLKLAGKAASILITATSAIVMMKNNNLFRR